MFHRPPPREPLSYTVKGKGSLWNVLEVILKQGNLYRFFEELYIP